MTDTQTGVPEQRNIWLRGLLMLLMAIAFQLSGTLLALAGIFQFVLALVGEKHNERLSSFGRSLGLYLGQIADFVTFVTEEVPFPLNAWPAER